MKKIYLTEEQYIDYILLEYSKFGVLDESKFDIRKIFQVLYRGCETFADYARRTSYVIAAGFVSATLLFHIITTCMPISNNEKQELITQVENTVGNNSETQERKQVINLNFRISEDGLNHIKQYEKCYLKPYYATKSEKQRGIRTIGWGHKIISTDPSWLKKAEAITQEQADELLVHDIKLYENELKEMFKRLPEYLQNVELYSQGFVDACISMIFNSGRGNLMASPFFKTLAKCRIDKDGNINIDDYNFTCSKIKDSCITQRGKIVNGLLKRRQEESLKAMR